MPPSEKKIPGKLSKYTDKLVRDAVGNQYDRETRLNIGTTDYNLYNAAIVIGCGGTGSWTSFFLGKIRTIQHLYLIDPDTIETSNLQRTPYHYSHIGEPKVSALASIISGSSLDTTIFPINRYFNEETANDLISEKLLQDCVDKSVLVIDCRDNDFQDHDQIKRLASEFSFNKLAILRCAYNGISVTLDFDPESHPSWGEGGYTETPSHVIPASMAAFLVVSAAFKYYEYKNKKPWIFNNPMTFNSTDFLEMLSMGHALVQPPTSEKDRIELSIVLKDMIQQKEVSSSRKGIVREIVARYLRAQFDDIKEKLTPEIIERAVEIALKETEKDS